MDEVASKNVMNGGVDAPPADLFPASSITTSVSMKLLAFWPEAAKDWFAQAAARFAIKNVTDLKTSSSSSSRINSSAPRSYPVCSCHQPLRGAERAVYHSLSLFLQQLPEVQGSGFPTSHLMLALLPDEYKPDFILRGLFLRHLPYDVHSHLLQEKVSDLRALALKANEFFQSKTLSPVNLLLDLQDDSVQVNAAVSTRTCPTFPRQVPSQHSATPALSTLSPSSPVPCWYHKKPGD